MTKFGLLAISLLFPFVFSHSQAPDSAVNDHPVEELRTIENNAFRVGEYLKYRIHYGFINAGIAELSVKDKTYRNNRPVYHMVGKGRSVGMAEWFFKTRDTYETYMDTQALIPWEFIRDVNEGGYLINRHLIFDQYNHKATDLDVKLDTTYNIMNYAQDMLSMFYYARCLETENLTPGQSLPVNMFLDHEDFSFRLKYLGKETIDSEWGDIQCKKFIPVVQAGRVFKEKEGLTLWVSDDENKIPIRLEAELAVGSIKMDLVDYRNNLHPLHFH